MYSMSLSYTEIFGTIYGILLYGKLDKTNYEWNTLALDRKIWKLWGEAFAQKWHDAG